MSELRIEGETARLLLQNVVYMLGRKAEGLPLWSICGHLTGHGSTYSVEICKSAGLDPVQIIRRNKPLKTTQTTKPSDGK